MNVFALFITNPATGYTTVRTYPTAFDRGLEMIMWSCQPVIMRAVDYSPDDKLRMAKAESVRPVHV